MIDWIFKRRIKRDFEFVTGLVLNSCVNQRE